MLIKLAHFLEIMLYVLVAGVMWGTWLALGRTMTQYGAGTFLTDGKHMIANLGVVMAVLIIAAVVAGLVAAFWLFRARSTTAAWLALAGLLLMVAVLVVTLAVEVPIDNKISSWSVATLPPDWRDIRAQWAGFHTLRTATTNAAALLRREGDLGRLADAAHADVIACASDPFEDIEELTRLTFVMKGGQVARDDRS